MRVYKHFSLGLRHPAFVGRNMSFSSYPGKRTGRPFKDMRWLLLFRACNRLVPSRPQQGLPLLPRKEPATNMVLASACRSQAQRTASSQTFRKLIIAGVGECSSDDDFYLMQPSGLAVLQTTNSILNRTLYQRLMPQVRHFVC